MLYGNRVFADVIQLRILRGGDYLVLSRWALNAIVCVIRGRQKTDKREGNVKMMEKW